jgi:hypothetical protein
MRTVGVWMGPPLAGKGWVGRSVSYGWRRTQGCSMDLKETTRELNEGLPKTQKNVFLLALIKQ